MVIHPQQKKKKKSSSTHLRLAGIQGRHYAMLLFYSFVGVYLTQEKSPSRVAWREGRARQTRMVISIFQIRKQICFSSYSYITDLF